MSPNRDRRFVILVSVQVIATLFLAGLIWVVPSTHRAITTEKELRVISSKLLSAGLIEEALPLYEEYLKNSNDPPTQKSAIAFSLGEMYERLGNVKKALVWYYHVETLNASQPTHRKAQKRVVAILESLGKSAAAKSALENSTTLRPESKKPSEEVVVARMGDHTIYLHDIEAALDRLPPELKKIFSKKDGKKEFAKKYVAEELLYKKAIRAGRESQPEVQKHLELLKKQALIQTVLEQDIYKKIDVDEKDLRNFFEAHKKEFTEEKQSPPKFADVRPTVENQYRLEKAQGLYQKLVDELAQAEGVEWRLENVP